MAHNDAYDDETRQRMRELHPVERSSALTMTVMQCNPRDTKAAVRGMIAIVKALRRRQNDCAWRRRHFCGRSGWLRPMRFTPEPQYSKATPATLCGASEIDADRDVTARQFG